MALHHLLPIPNSLSRVTLHVVRAWPSMERYGGAPSIATGGGQKGTTRRQMSGQPALDFFAMLGKFSTFHGRPRLPPRGILLPTLYSTLSACLISEIFQSEPGKDGFLASTTEWLREWRGGLMRLSKLLTHTEV